MHDHWKGVPFNFKLVTHEFCRVLQRFPPCLVPAPGVRVWENRAQRGKRYGRCPKASKGASTLLLMGPCLVLTGRTYSLRPESIPESL